jgi:hypothetical protein
MCFVRISEQTATFALQNIKRLVFISEVESVYSAVRTESLYKTATLRLYRVNYLLLITTGVRFPMVSLEFFIDIILPVALWPWD